MQKISQNKPLVILVAILLLANLAFLSFVVFKKKDRGRMDRKPHQVSNFVQKELGFNGDQAAKFEQLVEQHKESVKPVLTDIQKLKDSLYGRLKDPSTPDSVVSSITYKIGLKQQERELLLFNHFQRVRAICDSSQVVKFDSLVHKMVNRGPGMRKGDKKFSRDRRK